MTHDALQRWLDAYVDAWRTYDPAAIGALFAQDATYAYHPYDEGEEVVRGREAISLGYLRRSSLLFQNRYHDEGHDCSRHG